MRIKIIIKLSIVYIIFGITTFDVRYLYHQEKCKLTMRSFMIIIFDKTILIFTPRVSWWKVSLTYRFMYVYVV